MSWSGRLRRYLKLVFEIAKTTYIMNDQPAVDLLSQEPHGLIMAGNPQLLKDGKSTLGSYKR